MCIELDHGLTKMRHWFMALNSRRLWQHYILGISCKAHLLEALRPILVLKITECRVHNLGMLYSVHILETMRGIYIFRTLCSIHILGSSRNIHVLKTLCNVHLLENSHSIHVFWALCGVFVLEILHNVLILETVDMQLQAFYFKAYSLMFYSVSFHAVFKRFYLTRPRSLL